MVGKPKGVLLLTFGGPDSLEAVEPFMASIMGGRKPPFALVEKMIERYRLIGGKSPLPEVTAEQARLLQESLNATSDEYRVYVGMLHWHPLIKVAVEQMVADGVEEIIAVSLSPHFAQVTTGAYAKAIQAALNESGTDLPVKFAPGWYEHPLFIAGLAERLQAAQAELPEELRQAAEVIFSAHSLPVAHIQEGDPYADQMQATVSALVKKAGVSNWHLAYQSKGGGQGEWLGPDVEEVMVGLAEEGKKAVVVSPIGFATDHIETLYDIDIAQREHANALGLEFQRASALNTSPNLIQVLAEAVRSAS